MSKVLKDSELLEIVRTIIHGKDVISERQCYVRFVSDLGHLIADYCGGEVVTVSDDLQEEELGVCAHFIWNEAVPGEGGVYAEFDTDVSVEEWALESQDLTS
jgi:hypothetical protein